MFVVCHHRDVSVYEHTRTTRLALDQPVAGDLTALHDLYSDPGVWSHAPHARHTSVDATRSMLTKWLSEWDAASLGQWIVRRAHESQLLGNAGCALRGGGTWWNLAYRLDPAAQGQGYAAEAAAAAMAAAHQLRPDLPVVASLLEHNEPSRRLATRLGLELTYRGSDPRTQDQGGVRLLYADRPLNAAAIDAVLHP